MRKKISTKVDRRLFGLRLREPLMRQLRHAALDAGRPTNQLLEEIMEEWLQKNYEKR